MANRSGGQPAKRTGGINATFLGLVFLGICVLISGLNIGGNIKKLNKMMEEKTFSAPSSFSVPDSMNMGEKKYLSEAEAGEYLNLSAEKIVELINSGDIDEYVKTADGYSISVSVLDKWFDDEAYKTKHKLGGGASDDGEDGENSGE